jgi:protein phosphatase
MATTLVTAVVRGDELVVANVGDSRAYLIRGMRAYRLTRDHSWVAEMRAKRILTPEEAKHHLYRKVLTRSLGSKPDVKVDIHSYLLLPGDVIILCSDGLSDHVRGWEMAWMAFGRSVGGVTRSLINLAKRRGSDDDITAIVVRMLGWPELRPVSSLFQLGAGFGAAALFIFLAMYILASQ